ncbi:hypothetical protein [Rufibacter psychrotolerans]|uniref:hypothetical protein n=1 Tax=Rufibacter psychrotolerans TaxID=2812556 RepID=UPI001967BDD1|nr:hypothetical protein [Rufibacter sp. SYSU D00308]
MPQTYPLLPVMRHLIFGMLALLGPGCDQPANVAGTPAKPAAIAQPPAARDSAQPHPHFRIEQATSAQFDAAKSRFNDPFRQDTLLIRKKQGVLRIPTRRLAQPYVVFTDTLVGTDEVDAREFRYAGQYPTIGHYLVTGAFWEHYEGYLINQATGTVTTTWSDPVLSPGQRYLANLSLPYGLEGVPNGVQVWQVTPSAQGDGSFTVRKFLELDQQVWAPRDFVWESDHAILLQVTPVEFMAAENGMPSNTFQYLRLRLR